MMYPYEEGICIRLEKTVQTQIKVKEQFDQGLHYLPFCHNIFNTSQGRQTDLHTIIPATVLDLP